MNKRDKILIIDNSKSILNNIKNYLEKMGFTIFTADNYFSGISCYETFSPDLVIADIVIPDTDGLELILNFKKLFPECKIIAMCAMRNVVMISAGKKITYEDCLTHAKKLGACGTISKPLNKKILLSEIIKQLT